MGKKKTGHGESAADYVKTLVRKLKRSHDLDLKEERDELENALDDGWMTSVPDDANSLGRNMLTVGALKLLDEDQRGWREIQLGVRWWAWGHAISGGLFDQLVAKKTKPKRSDIPTYLRFDVTDAALGLAMAIGLRQDAYADWCGQRLIGNFTGSSVLSLERQWYRQPFELFMIKLYSRWRGIEEEVMRKPGKELRTPWTGDDAAYDRLLAAWDDKKQFSAAAEAMCEYHLTSKSTYIHDPFHVLPVEYWAVSRIRQEMEMPMPPIKHPLVKTSLGHAPAKLPRKSSDALLARAVKVTREELPELDAPWEI